MMVRGFREVGWVAAVAGTALGCYMVSLKVASERAALDQVQNRIVLAQRDIRVLQTEIGTRGRLEQLESWNVKVLALSAPKAQQFLEGEFQLATLTAPKKTVDPAAPVVLASAPATAPAPRVADPDAQGSSARDLMQVASLRRDIPEPGEKTVDKPKVAPVPPVKPAAKAARAAASTDKAPAAAATPRKEKVAAKAPTDSAKSKPSPKAATPPASTKSKDAKARQ